MSEPFIVMKPSELRKMMIDTFKEVLKDTEEPKPKEKEEPIPMAELINSKNYGSRNSIQKYRDEIMAEGNDPVIFVKHGNRYYLYLSRFKEWFMKQDEKRKEKLKVDPRRRESWRRQYFSQQQQLRC